MKDLIAHIAKAIVDTPSVNVNAQYHFGDDTRINSPTILNLLLN